jgi:hypothetical protein
MIGRTQKPFLLAALLLAGALAGCKTKDMPASEDALAAAAPGAPAQCFWLSNQGTGWQPRPDLPEVDYCYEMDSCSGGAGMSGGGCYKWATGPGDPGKPWDSFGLPVMSPPEAAISEAPEPDPSDAQAASPAQCFWLSNQDKGWVTRPDLPDPYACHEMDSCTGGAGMSGGGCYKWAIGANAPGLPWESLYLSIMPPSGRPARAKAAGPACYLQPGARDAYNGAEAYWGETECFRLGACPEGHDPKDYTVSCYKWAMGPDEPALPWSERITNPVLAASIPPPKDLYEDSFEITSDTCFENCPPNLDRIDEPTTLYERPDPGSPRLATIPAGECVDVRDFKSLSTPLRGVVLETYDGYVAGDVIYYLNYDGEGTYTAWWRGDYTGADDGLQVRWDPKPVNPDPRAGPWRELLRADGMRGWAKAAPYDPEAEPSEPCS